MKKVLFVATVVKHHIMEFHIPYLQMFKELGWETSVAAKNDYENLDDCVIPYCDIYYNISFKRKPFDVENIKAYKELKKIISKEKYDIIHCHTPVGAFIGRMAAKKVRRYGTKVIYTAHGFHFYTGAPLKNWLLYYFAEKIMASYTDVLITINHEDYERAQKKLRTGKVFYVPGVGIDINKFSGMDSMWGEKRGELGLDRNDFILLSVGGLIPVKNQKVVIDALGLIKSNGKIDKIQYLVCGMGAETDELKKQSIELGVQEHIHFLGYRHDISEICNASDLFMFLQGGLPVALIEAMSCGLPVICTAIRGNTDLIKNGVNGVFCGNNPEDIAQNIVNIMENQEKCRLFGRNAREAIKSFDLLNLPGLLKDICLDCISTSELDRSEVMPKMLLRLAEQQKLRVSLNIPLDATVILSVGEINKNKNHKIVIDALRIMKDEGKLPNMLYYVICGRGELLQSLKDLVKLYKLTENVLFIGYRDDVEHMYIMADIFVFPSIREGLGCALIEAMASGLPCIAAKNRGTKEIIFDNGMFFDSSDAVQVKNIIFKLLVS